MDIVLFRDAMFGHGSHTVSFSNSLESIHLKSISPVVPQPNLNIFKQMLVEKIKHYGTTLSKTSGSVHDRGGSGACPRDRQDVRQEYTQNRTPVH